MHDLIEGVVPFLLKALFQHCISKKIFTEDWLQKKIQFFDFGPYNKNVPSIVKKDCSHQNAAQLMCIFQNIGFIFYHLRNHKEIKTVWICVESLQKIVQICYSSKIFESDINILEKNVTIHLKNILKIFDLSLLPKHHLLLHYPDIIREMGPICHMNMIRYEAKHKALKTIAKRGNNFINITKTISFRNQAELVYRGFTYCDEVDCGRISQFDFSNFNEVESTAFARYFEKNEALYQIQWLKFNNFTFRKYLAVLHEKVFYEIDSILVMSDKYFFLCNTFDFQKFDSFTNSLIVKKYLWHIVN